MKDFTVLFNSFMRKFPPVASAASATLKLTTGEIMDSFENFWPGIDITAELFVQHMIGHGYQYEPFEVNDRIVFYWLIGSADQVVS